MDDRIARAREARLAREADQRAEQAAREGELQRIADRARREAEEHAERAKPIVREFQEAIAALRRLDDPRARPERPAYVERGVGNFGRLYTNSWWRGRSFAGWRGICLGVMVTVDPSGTPSFAFGNRMVFQPKQWDRTFTLDQALHARAFQWWENPSDSKSQGRRVNVEVTELMNAAADLIAAYVERP